MTPADALKALPGVHGRAAKRGMQVSAYLEHEDPSSRYGDGDSGRNLDAFGRLLREAQVITHSNPAAGLYATPIGDLLDGSHQGADGQPIGRDVGRALAMIWIERRWRSAKYGKTANTRAMFTSEDDPIGSAIRPWEDNGTIRDTNIRPKITVGDLVAMETGINDSSYRTIYLEESPATDLEYKRITEGTEIPTSRLRTREQTVRIVKRGRAIDWTYEAARRMRLDKFQLFVTKMALAVEAGKVNDAIAVAINGDGNPGTAADVINISELDAIATGDGITFRGYLGFDKEFDDPFTLNTLLARKGEIIDLELLEVGPLNMPFVALGNATGIRNITPFGNRDTSSIQYGTVKDAVPALTYLGMDRNFALERVSEIGATVSEADRFITSQVEVLTFTEAEGFASLFSGAVKLLNVDRA
jgi:hypothetical protein